MSQKERVKTGPVKINETSGFFIRGDDSLNYSDFLAFLVKNPGDEVARIYMKELTELLSQTENNPRVINVEGEKNLETGPIRIDDDWMGLFIDQKSSVVLSTALSELLDGGPINSEIITPFIRALESVIE